MAQYPPPQYGTQYPNSQAMQTQPRPQGYQAPPPYASNPGSTYNSSVPPSQYGSRPPTTQPYGTQQPYGSAPPTSYGAPPPYGTQSGPPPTQPYVPPQPYGTSYGSPTAPLSSYQNYPPQFPYESTTKSSRNSSWCGWGSSKNGKDDQAADFRDMSYADILVQMDNTLAQYRNQQISPQQAMGQCDTCMSQIRSIAVVDGDRATSYLAQRGITDERRMMMERTYEELCRETGRPAPSQQFPPPGGPPGSYPPGSYPPGSYPPGSQPGAPPGSYPPPGSQPGYRPPPPSKSKKRGCC
mmetsp:Transcript_52242/g.122260  ORF Transcript_52242/g.122260 Transcript_52242/m.122260 type:complete len:296 (-) Transcript_52242:34-921(-)